MFERYVNFEFYKTVRLRSIQENAFERYVSFEFYKTKLSNGKLSSPFERYVNFEFYKTDKIEDVCQRCLRDM